MEVLSPVCTLLARCFLHELPDPQALTQKPGILARLCDDIETSKCIINAFILELSRNWQ
jgi:hypothetical protein